MCSMFNGMNRLELHFDSSLPQNLTRTDDVTVEWCVALSFLARLVAYVAVLALIVIIVLMILKYVADFSDEGNDQEQVRRRPTETSPLLCQRNVTPPLAYRACEEDSEKEDIETGSCSSGEELYDGRICVICYDEQRNCFFVPCGHCATCYDCAQRIYEGENKVCPVCRRLIGKVRKLFAP